jgi:hypothetical protein
MAVSPGRSTVDDPVAIQAGVHPDDFPHIVDGADHASFWRDPETVKESIAAILDVMKAAEDSGALQ